MGRYFDPLWILTTTILSGIFGLILFWIINPKLGAGLSIGLIALSVLVIWGMNILGIYFLIHKMRSNQLLTMKDSI